MTRRSSARGVIAETAGTRIHMWTVRSRRHDDELNQGKTLVVAGVRF